jgi:hypothetical protein
VNVKESKLATLPKEREKPLTLTLSMSAQEGVFACLMPTLKKLTHNEIEGFYKSESKVIEQIDEARNVVKELAKNLGKHIHPMEALEMGLTELIPPKQLEEWAKTPNAEIRKIWDLIIRKKAKYLLQKSAKGKTHLPMQSV